MEARELASGVDALYLSGHGAVHPDVLTELAHQRDLAEIRLPATYCLGSLPFAVAAHGWGKYHYCLDHPIGRIGMSRAGTSHRYGSSRARRRRHRSSSDSGGGGGPGPSGASHPCRIVGDGSDRPPERPMLTVAEVEAVTEAMSERLRAAVLLASWGGLRRGEIRGLQRRDVNELAGGVAVERTLHELHTGEVVYGPPKSKAGARFVHLPKPIVTVLPAHLDAHVAANPQSPVFPSTTGGPMRPRFLESDWRRARRAVGLEHIRFHDLRYFHLTMFATQGATTAELMARAGHSSPKAALTYQLATSDRDKVLADALAEFVAPPELTPMSDETLERSRQDRAKMAAGEAGTPALTW